MNPSYNKEPAIENRTMVLVWTVVVVLAIFLIRLLTVQILDHKYHELAQQNAIRRVNAYAPRGIIFDRNGKKIVVNRPIYDLMVVPGELPQPLDTARLADLIRLPLDELVLRLRKATTYSRFGSKILRKSRKDSTILAESMRKPEPYVPTSILRQLMPSGMLAKPPRN